MADNTDFRFADRGSPVPKRQVQEVPAPIDVAPLEELEETLENLPEYRLDKHPRIGREIEGKPVIRAEGPEFSNQLTHPLCRGTFKIGVTKAAHLDLSDATQLAEYNNLLAKSEPAGAPLIIIDTSAPMQGPKGFIMLLRYREVTYYKIIK